MRHTLRPEVLWDRHMQSWIGRVWECDDAGHEHEVYRSIHIQSRALAWVDLERWCERQGPREGMKE